MEVVHIDPSRDFFQLLDIILQQIKQSEYTPDYIIGVARGGLVPAVYLSYALDIKLIPWGYSSYSDSKKTRYTSNNKEYSLLDLRQIRNKKLLVVDDICDSGNTLAYFQKEYSQSCQAIKTACLYKRILDDWLVIHEPDYVAKTIDSDFWAEFPWETMSELLKHEK